MSDLAVITIVAIAAAAGGIIGWVAAAITLRDEPADEAPRKQP